MKRTVSISMVALLAFTGCKRKDDSPAPPAALASTAATLASALATPPSASAAPRSGDFEGEIALLVKGKFTGNEATPINLTLLIKNNRVRIDLPESLSAVHGLGPVHVLALPEEKKLYALFDTKKQAVLLELDKIAEQAQAFGARPRSAAAPAPHQPPRLEKTGKSDTVAGIKCDIWQFSQGKTEGEACIAEQDASWLHFPSNGEATAELSWLTPLADGKHFPLRFVATERSIERGRVEVKSLQAKPLQASLFELPRDYAVLSLEQMVGSMLGGLGGPGFKLPPGVKLPPGSKLPQKK